MRSRSAAGGVVPAILAALAWAALAAALPGAEPPPVPTAVERGALPLSAVEQVFAPLLDLAALAAEDETREALGLPPRFAVAEGVLLTPADHGLWESLGDGRFLWRVRVTAPGAASLNLGFGRYRLPEEARLLVHSADNRRLLGPFTAADNDEHGELWTPIVAGDDLVVELTVAGERVGEVELELTSINQGYRGFGTAPGDKSGSCNMDVECLDSGDSWRNQVRSVGVISLGGSTFCSGSLVNDTSNDQRMFFITANHCGINSGNAASLVVYWNYENSTCRTPGSAASGQPGDGTLNQFHSGSIFRASYSSSDVTLVELDDPAVPAYNHYWAGWDRTTGTPSCSAGSPCTTIHHPSTDEKRITYVISNMATTSYGGVSAPGDGTHLWSHWATDPPGPFTTPGVTEPGSSGSPLYNASHRFVGQLHGGPSACGATGDDLSDYYGRFNISWTGGGTSSTRLSSWLDAAGTGATTLNGLDSSGGAPAAPSSLSATPLSATQISLAWTDNSSNETAFKIESKGPGGDFTEVASVAANTEAATISSLAQATYYSFRVRAANGSGNSAYSNEASATTLVTPGACVASATELCLQGDRYFVKTNWRDYQSNVGSGTGIEFTSDSGLFWFFNANNIEFLVKVLNGCGVNSRYWVYAAGTTDVEYVLTVADMESGQTKSYVNTLGTASPAITDSAAFATCP